ncbi:MAG: hypothetical protein ACI9DK_003125 [Vicingaceae bacterium]|jgi:hypothetical protein
MEAFGKLIPEEIQLADFGVIKGGINCPLDHDNSLVLKHDYKVDFNLAYNLETNEVQTDFDFKVKTISSDKQVCEAKGKFKFAFLFNVNNLVDLVRHDDEKDELMVSPHLGNALASITYSTSRGILMTRFQGTALSDFILPIVNPNDLLK